MNYYNDNGLFAAQWLRNLIVAELLPVGDVDERPIADVQASDLIGYSQCHFFAGIGGWAYALSLAGWKGKCWTGSCPCQPFSRAGRKEGTDSEKHLWPEFYRLIAVCKPPIVFGEQVATKIGFAWLDGVQADLEAAGYSTGAADLCAGGVGAPHIRQRIYWGAILADSYRDGPPSKVIDHRQVCGFSQKERQSKHCTAISWRDSVATEILDYSDGYRRRSECGALPLAYGVPKEMERVRAYGNAIVPQIAAEFVGAFMEAAQ